MVPELAFYYGNGHYGTMEWIGSDNLLDWAKSILLFFDGIATNYSKRVFNKLVNDDPVLAQPLMEQGLLYNYPPKRQKVKLPSDIDGLVKDQRFRAAVPYIEKMFEHADALHPQLVWNSVNAAIEADQLRAATTDASIQPITNNSTVAKIASEWVNSFANASKADIIEADVEAVGIDLSKVPLDEVLDFRKQHGSEYRDYARELRDVTLTLSLMNPALRSEAMQSASVHAAPAIPSISTILARRNVFRDAMRRASARRPFWSAPGKRDSDCLIQHSKCDTSRRFLFLCASRSK